ncbi:hypothetical protein [Sphingomonas bacterium]|uniref:hypothetical protein n=1 Tax=Sphingomonas bacterium TaxID=1895847 RepID=UPI002616487B|nr:hypothetical protein [Sphingomonas bacterium]
MILVLLGLLRVYMLYNSNGYLGPPFVFDVGDTFMDWFHTAYWAHHGAAYSFWRTIYLPLSFVITGTIGNSACYESAQYDARDCDWIGYVAIVAMYVGCVVVSAVALWRHDRTTAIYRSVAIAAGQPLLFALERGNLVMLTYIPFVLLYGGLMRTNRGVAFAAAFMANMKIYMILPLLAIGIKRQWRLLELCGIATIALYLITLFIVGEGTPIEIYANLQNWFSVRIGAIWDELLYTTTYRPFLVLDEGQYPVRDYIDERYVAIGKAFIQAYYPLTRGIALLCLGLAWLYPRAVSMNRLVFFFLMQSFIGQNPGGYSISLIVFIVFMERKSNFAVITAIICCYLINFPGDFTLAKIYDFERESWLSGRTVLSEYTLPVGSLIRPGLIAISLWVLAIDTLIDVHRVARRERPCFGLRGRPGMLESAPADAPAPRPGTAAPTLA